MGEEIMNYLGFGGEEYDDYDEHEYFYPSFDSGVIGQGLWVPWASAMVFSSPSHFFHLLSSW